MSLAIRNGLFIVLALFILGGCDSAVNLQPVDEPGSQESGDQNSEEGSNGAFFVTMSASASSGAAPLTVEFIKQTGGDLNADYRWDFGDGTSGSGLRSTHTYTNKGTYTSTLTATNQNGETTTTATVIFVWEDTSQENNDNDQEGSSPYFITMSASPSSGTVPLNVEFRKQAGGDENTGYQWDFGDGARASGWKVSHTYTVAGTYTVKLTATNRAGDTATSSSVVTVANNTQVDTPFFVTMSASPLTGSAPLEVNFSKQTGGDGSTQYKWNFGDGGTATGQSARHTYTQPGSYTATLIATNSSGKVVSTNQNIRISEAPRPEPAPEPESSRSLGQFWGNSYDNGPNLNNLYTDEGSSTRDVKSTTLRGERGGQAAFRISCGTSHFAYDDPIVKPGQVNSTHLHMFFGNTKTNGRSSFESLRNSGNSTCSGGIANRSAYWVPAMLDANGEPVVAKKIGVYYKSGGGGVPGAQISQLPEGLRIIAGDMMATTPQQSYINYICGTAYSRNRGIPSCRGTMTMSINFPQCWDGINLDSVDHKRHMAYAHPSTRGCPSSHPVALPAIKYNVTFPVNGNTSGWRLASDLYDGGVQGYSAHGDWFGAWDPEISRAWRENCLNKGLDCGGDLLGDGRTLF